MKTLVLTLASAVALSSSALAQTQAFDPAAGNNDPRIISVQETPVAPAMQSAVATNSAPSAIAGGKHYFGPSIDRAVDSMDSPYNN